MYRKKLFLINRNKNIIKTLNQNIIETHKSNEDITIGVCIRAKDEQNIICDFVTHYLKLGFDKIIIYDNLSNPSIQETLQKNNILNNRIKIVIDNTDHSNQPVVYLDCINNNKDLDWLLLCDTDEFIYIKEGNIKTFLNTFSEDTCTFLINWLVYGTSNNKTYDNSKSIYSQFTKREDYNHFWNRFVKSFVRPKLIENFGNVHITYNNNYKVKNIYNDIIIINDNNKCDHKDNKLSDDTNIVLVHYMTLDFESMLKKRIKNARQDLGFTLKNNKYSLEWYNSHYYGFKDNNNDLRMLKYEKKNLYFVINYGYNHQTIINEGGGASELLFYKTAYLLSPYYNVTIFNNSEECNLDNIEYKKITKMDENINNSIFIVQRHFNNAVDLHKTNSSNTYILWSHDFLESSFSNLTGNYSPLEINDYFRNNNMKVVAVSNFHKNNIIEKLPDVNVITIYNSLFSDIIIKNDNIQFDKNTIVFASNWAKGLDKILLIGKEYYKVNKDFKLILIKPNYCDWEPDLSQYEFIDCRGNIKNKQDYCNLLQSALCIFTTSYPETFGCAFAEALHLGVPVIGDNSVNAGFQEFINSNYLCNFNNPDEVIKKIEEIRNNIIVKLDEKFYEKSIVNEWIKIL